MVKLSICIPVYHNPAGVNRLLESLRVQTFRDYDVWISVDTKDGSEDEEYEKIVGMAAEFAAETGLACTCKAHRECGAAANWNAAMDLADGEYIKLIHHDDWLTDQNSLAQFVRLLDVYPECDLAFSGSRQMILPAGGGIPEFQKDRHAPAEDIQKFRSDYHNLFFGNTIGAPSAVIVRRTLPGRGLRYREDLSYYVDMDYYMQALAINPRFTFTDEPLISIGVSETQLTNKCLSDPVLLREERLKLYRDYQLEKLGDTYRKRLAKDLAESGMKLQELPRDLGIDQDTYKHALYREQKARRNRRIGTIRYLLGKVGIKV